MNQALGTPFFAARAKGSRVWDITGREFIDMCCAHGAALLGHGHPAVAQALRQAIKLGFVNSFETEFHEELARRVCALIPCAEKIRFCSSGSEATLHLIRICRGFTGRNKIIRIEGHFHGYHELIYIGGQPPPDKFPENRNRPYLESAGIPSEFANLIIPLPYNDPPALRQAIAEHGKDTALVILEPVNYNSGCILPQPGYLELVRQLTKDAGIILFFDEIQSSFKKSSGGAQHDFGVIPDVCTIGKSLGGGLPLSAFCGRADIMDMCKPIGPVQHSGTFNAHLVPVLAGLAFLEEAAKPGFYPHLRALEVHFHEGLDRIINDYDLNMVAPHHGARFNIILGRRTPALRYEDAFCHSRDVMLQLIRECWERGLYLHDYGGSPAHHGYSIQHTKADIDRALNVLADVLKAMKPVLKKPCASRSVTRG
ncbi:MAG: aminotransferase class III-fold pyridoxal phosphate-dependent enzyme [Verrucomicrobia bacterium]|nr:aminotransferase class III-fold pyridoxal phosphate-dependent enzyme [Verrucomicrobiota bacterium]MBU1735532.1 aminotransferase class III-fold pyridoxal phosphate-dependent enzyme [Verrucomicrobiota bacterium]MBU1857999.1 aminotransferase class III-fold pyridoxal phosphate-dependent enzyme [Verrucomicrobiota bacterium]